MVHGPVREVFRGPSPLDWSTDRGSVFSGHPKGQAANNLLLVREHSPYVNNKPISIPYLEQGYRCNLTIFNLKVEF